MSILRTPSTSAPRDAQAVRPKSTRRPLWYVRGAVLALLLLVALYLGTRTFLAARLTPSRINAEMSTLAGMQVSAADVHLTWSGGIRLRALHVRAPDHEVLSCPLATIHLSLWDLLWHRMRSVSVSLHAPKLMVDGSDVSTLRARLTASGPVVVNVEDGSLSVARAGGNPYRVRALDGRFELTRISTDFSCNFEDPRGSRYAVSGRTTPDALRMEGRVRDLSLLTLVGWKGRLDGYVQVDGSYTSAGVKGKAVVRSDLGGGTISVTSGRGGIDLESLGRSGDFWPGPLTLETRDWALGGDPRLHGLQGSGVMAVASEGNGRPVLIDLDFPALEQRGRLLGPLRGRLAYRAPLLQVRQVLVPLGRSGQSVTGRINVQEQTLALESVFRAADLSRLASLSGLDAPACEGTLHGRLRIRGTFQRPRAQFTGYVRALKVDGRPVVSRARLMAIVTPQEARVTARHLRAKTLAPAQSLLPGLGGTLNVSTVLRPGVSPILGFRLETATLQGRRLPPLWGRMAWSNPVATFTELVFPGYRGRGVVDVARRTYRFTGRLRNCSLGSLPRPARVPSLVFAGRFTGPLFVAGSPDTLIATFSGIVRALQVTGMALGSGHLDCRVDKRADGRTVLDVAVSRMSGGPPFLPRDLRLHGVLQGSQLSVRPLVVRSLGLSLVGQVDMASRVLHLKGRLGGQSFGAMAGALGLRLPGVRGNLYGPLSLDGPLRHPRMRFQGSARRLTYQGMALGSGRLQLVASQSFLSGRLLLDRPVSVASASAARSSRFHLPWLAGLAARLLDVRVVGATIGGTPQHPVVTPVTKGLPGMFRGVVKMPR